jgi:hypothetical protein
MTVGYVLAGAAVFILVSGLVLAVAKARRAAIICTGVALLMMVGAGTTLVIEHQSEVRDNRVAAKAQCEQNFQQAEVAYDHRSPQERVDDALAGTDNPPINDCG